MPKEDTKIAVYDQGLVKATLDDALVDHLNENAGWVETTWESDKRLILGAICCILGAIVQFWPHEFPANYWVIVFTATGYFTCSTIMQYGLGVLDSRFLYHGTKDGANLYVTTAMDRHSAFYEFSVGRTTDPVDHVAFKSSVGEYFTEDGHFVAANFHAAVNKVISQALGQPSSSKKNK
jgi:hypothetical protein